LLQQVYFKHLIISKKKNLYIKGENHMEQIKKILQERETQLQQLKKEKEKALTKAPEGSLRLCQHGDKIQYYHRNNPKDFNGVYIKEKDIELAKQLAQKDYDKKVLTSAERELGAINKFFLNYPDKSVEEIYENMHEGRKRIITPIMETEEQYVQQWQQETYQGKTFPEDTPELYTQKGERVRSKSELIIADMLNKAGIPYRYEYPLYIKGFGKIYPDFTVLNIKKRKELFWEHFGMMDDPEYAETAIRKITTYEQNGIYPGEKLILTYETRKNPINQKVVKGMIEHFLI